MIVEKPRKLKKKKLLKLKAIQRGTERWRGKYMSEEAFTTELYKAMLIGFEEFKLKKKKKKNEKKFVEKVYSIPNLNPAHPDNRV